jgi:hypothetical protein
LYKQVGIFYLLVSSEFNYFIARYNSVGYSPFSIENAANLESNQLYKGYSILHQLTPLILEHQGKGMMSGFLLDSAEYTAKITVEEFTFNVKHKYKWLHASCSDGETPRFGGMIRKVADDEFYIARSSVIETIESSSDDGTTAGIASLDEGIFVKGKWIIGRRLNGDEDYQGRYMHLPGKEYSTQKVKLNKYKQ